MNSVIIKQLLINSLPIPAEIQDSIKEHLFIDHITMKTRVHKKDLIHYINRFSYFEQDGHVAISHRYDFQFQSKFCLDCGGYGFVGNIINYSNISHSALCSCEGFTEYYQNNLRLWELNQPLNIYM